MSNRLVQQHAWPAWSQHHGHRAGRRRPCLEIGQRSLDRLLDIALQRGLIEEIEPGTPAATAMALLASSALLGDHGERQTHQRPHVGGNQTIGASDQHDVVLSGQSCHHLHDPGITRPGHPFDAFEQRDLGCGIHADDRIVATIERMTRRAFHPGRELHPTGASARDRARGLSSRAQGLEADVVGVGERGLVATDRAHANAAIDREAARFDDALLQAPALAARELEIEVGVIDAVLKDFSQHALQVVFVKAVGLEQKRAGHRQVMQ